MLNLFCTVCQRDLKFGRVCHATSFAKHGGYHKRSNPIWSIRCWSAFFSSENLFRGLTIEILLGKLTKRLLGHCSLVTLHSRTPYPCLRWEKGTTGRGRTRLGSLPALCLCEARLISYQCGCETSPEIPPPSETERAAAWVFQEPSPSALHTCAQPEG